MKKMANMMQPNAETIKVIEDVNLKRKLSGPYKSREALREALDAGSAKFKFDVTMDCLVGRTDE